MTKQELFTLIKETRIKRGFLQRDVAEKMALPKERISEIENNKSNLQCDKLLRLLDILELEIKDCS